MKKRAFTLAEVLISIGIIGVISLATLPALKTAAWSAQRDAQVRASYAKLTNAWNLAIANMEYAPKCAYWGTGGGANPNPYEVEERISSNGTKTWYIKGTNTPLPDTHNGLFTDCRDFGEAIIDQLKVKQTCYGNALSKGCIPKYDGNDSIYKWNGKEGAEIVTATSGMQGFKTSNIHNSNHAFVLNDGSIIIGYFSTNYFHPRIFAVDINGHKGPNQWGFDLFAFKSRFGKDGKKIELVGHDMPTKEGGVNITQILSHSKIK